MEIERKYLITNLPEDLDAYPFHVIEQAYICTDPVIRIRRQDDDYYLTCKGTGMMSREECNLPMSAQAYSSLMNKTEGCVIRKRRYLIPAEDGRTIELDCFEGVHAPLVIAEVEFESEDQANAFKAPGWFSREVTYDGRYHNSWLSTHTAEELDH